MTGTDIAVVITSLSTLVGVLGGILVQLRGQNEAKLAREALSTKMDAVQHTTDGLSDRLGAAKLAQGTAEGHAVGLEQGRHEQDQVP